jgi:hypothetical protein
VFMGRENITEICAIEDVFQRRENADPRLGADRAGNKSVTVKKRQERSLSARSREKLADERLTCTNRTAPASQ